MKKKIIGSLIILVTIITTFSIIAVKNVTKAEVSTADANGITWQFTIIGTNALNVYCADSSQINEGCTLEIPSTLTYNNKTYNVLSIGNGSNNILGTNNQDTRIVGISIPNTVTTINAYAFRNLPNLQGTVTIPDSVTTIGDYAFYGNSKVTKIEIGKNVSYIGKDYANTQMAGLLGLTEISVSDDNANYSSQDGILFNKNKTTLIVCPRKKEITNYVVPNTVNAIGSYAFYVCDLATGTITLPNGLLTIGSCAFNYSNISGEIVIPDTVTSIGSSAFRSCKKLTSLQLGSKVNTIGQYAFSECSGLKGDLIIPDSVTSISSNAFEDCTGFDGNLSIGNGLQTIENYTFSNDINFKKISIGSSITAIGYGSFAEVSDLWINNIKENVNVNSNAGGDSKIPYIHWLGDTHHVDISTVEGVSLVNTITGKAFTSGEYPCESQFDYKIVIADGYKYSNLKLVEINNDDTENYITKEIDTNKTYSFDRLIRNRSIYIQSINNNDLSLRTFITEVNREQVTDSRIPIAKLVNGKFEYNHTKYPITVKNGDTVTYTIRVYNEGSTEGTAKKVHMLIPKGMEIDLTNRTNIVNKWTIEGDGKISTDILASKSIKPYNGNGDISYEDINVLLKVTQEKPKDNNIRLNTIAEIEEENATDADSTPNSIKNSVDTSYKEQESYNSSAVSCIKGNEDDDDYEDVLMIGKIKVQYNIKINKIDTDTKELLAGAKFNLLNEQEEIIATATTDANGALDFGTLTTNGEGEDIYYIKEAEAPTGYSAIEKNNIKVTVIKKIIDEDKGTYSVNVVCDLLNYNVDTTRYEFTPIETVEQLQKVGSGEIVTIDGVDYQYNTNTNYKLMNDLDLTGIDWKPISKNVQCIIDGNNHKISNLTIKSKDDLPISEVGMFSTFSGIIENLELEKVNIDINGFTKDAVSNSGYTGVGAFAGVMQKGYLINCKVSGIVTAGVDNIGGFVGHTAKANMVKVQKCTNNADVVGKAITVKSTETTPTSGIQEQKTFANVGGIIGCALGAISITDSTNNGTIVSYGYNAGGLVGYAKSTDYEQVEITAEFDEKDRDINLVVENKNTVGKYSLILENIDGKTLGLIPGAQYKILDKDKKEISGLENVTLESGYLKLATFDIETLGLDTYYLQEIKPADGYEKLNSTIKLNVRRYWDNATESYKVSVEKEDLSDTELTDDKPKTEDTPLPSKTGSVFTKVIETKISWNSNKAEFKGCTNNGQIITNDMNSAGIIATSHCLTEITDCNNSGEIVSNKKSGGIISELNTDTLSNKCNSITSCANSGHIVAYGASTNGSAGGILSHGVGKIKISKCVNNESGKVQGDSVSKATAGIVADMDGELTVDSCENYATISARGNNGSVDSVAGGIVGKDMPCKDVSSLYKQKDNILLINNCKNFGSIYSDHHLGGIVGLSQASIVNIKSCTVKPSETNAEGKIYIVDTYAGDKAGIIGFSSNNSINIQDCDISNVIFERQSSQVGYTYGATSGVIGNVVNGSSIYGAGEYGETDGNSVNVRNCNVDNCTISTFGKETAGIIGSQVTNNANTKTNINDCSVTKCEINNIQANGCYSSSAGIFGQSNDSGKISIGNCIVDSCNIISQGNENKNEAYDMNVAGIMGIASQTVSVVIDNNDVKNCTVTAKSNPGTGSGYSGDTCANAGGIVGETIENGSISSGEFRVSNCNVIDTDISTNAGNLAGIWGVAFSNNSRENNPYEIANCNVIVDKKEKCILQSTSNTGSNTNTAGIISSLQSAKMNISKVKVSNADITGNGRNTSGIIAAAIYSPKVNIQDVKVLNTNITETANGGDSKDNDCVAGVIGVLSSDSTIYNAIVDNCKITSDNAANTAGLVSDIWSGKLILKNCTVSNSDITAKRDYAVNNTNNTASGLVGCASNLDIANCNVKNCNILGKGRISSGGVSFVQNSMNAKDCNVIDTNVANTSELAQGSTRSVAGFIGATSGETYLDNIKVDNMEITTNADTAGGLFGAIACNVKQLENCSVHKLTLTVNRGKMSTEFGAAGGLGAMIFINDSNSIINNNKVTDSTITVDTGAVGGLIGCVNGDGLNNYILNNCNVDNVGITNDNSNQCNFEGLVGGLVGITINGIKIQNSNVKNSSISTKKGIGRPEHVGGILGFADASTYDYTQERDCIMDNVHVINTTISNEETHGLTGGILGMTDDRADKTLYKLIISNSSVEDCTNISGNYHIGGIMGFGKIIATTNKIVNTTINGIGEEYEVYAGGIIGFELPDSNIDGAEMTNVNVSGYKAGGVVGMANANVANVTMTGSNITSKGVGNVTTGGIVSNMEKRVENKNITNCHVSNTKIITKNASGAGSGYTGGIVGFTIGTIDGCSVTDSEITASGMDGVGGIVGFGDTGVAIKNSQVSGNIVTGGNAEGKGKGPIIGELSEDCITNCTIDAPIQTPLGFMSPLMSMSPITSETTNNSSNTTNETQTTSNSTEGTQTTSSSTEGTQTTSSSTEGAQTTSNTTNETQTTSNSTEGTQTTSSSTEGAQTTSNTTNETQTTSNSTEETKTSENKEEKNNSTESSVTGTSVENKIVNP